MEQEIYKELKLNPAKQYWNLTVDDLKNLINGVEDENHKLFLEKCFYEYFEMSKSRPIERSAIMPYI